MDCATKKKVPPKSDGTTFADATIQLTTDCRNVESGHHCGSELFATTPVACNTISPYLGLSIAGASSGVAHDLSGATLTVAMR